MRKPSLSTLIPLLWLCSGTACASGILDRHFIFFPEPNLIGTPADAGLHYEEVFFSTEDGLLLHGWLVPGQPGKPLLVFAHGNAGNISHRIGNLAQLHRLGLTLFIFDYRGYGRSEGTTTEQGTYADMRGALDWLKNRGWNPAQMIYFGRSLGAAVALQLALEEPPAGLVMESAFTSIPRMGRRHYPILYALLGWWALNTRYDNLSKIHGLSCPLLLFQGERDRIVPPRMARQLLERAPEPKHLHLIAEAGHNNTHLVGGDPYWQAWKTFIDQVTATSVPDKDRRSSAPPLPKANEA